MQVLRFADRIASPWKNGGGVTWEYAVHPQGAGFDDFFWRVSRARVEGHGAFSVFPGIDRTLTLVDGEAIDLLTPDRRVRLDRTTPPFRFAGDDAIECRIPDGPIEDLNVMTRRGRWTHVVERHAVTAPTRLRLVGDVNMVVALTSVRITEPDREPVDLARGDAVVLEAASTVTIEPRVGTAEILAIRLDHLADPWAVRGAVSAPR